MKKKIYSRPEIEVVQVMTEGVVCAFSVDQTGNGGADGEQVSGSEGDLGDGEEVGGKDNTGGWNFNVWE